MTVLDDARDRARFLYYIPNHMEHTHRRYVLDLKVNWIGKIPPLKLFYADDDENFHIKSFIFRRELRQEGSRPTKIELDSITEIQTSF